MAEPGKTTTEPGAAPDAKETPKGADATTVTTLTEEKPSAEVDPKKAQEGKPDAEPKFELKLPEGSLLKPEAVERMTARAKELKLTPEQAQAELERESELVKTFVEGEKGKLAEQVKEWVAESSKDPEIGGEAFAKNAEYAKRVVNRFGTDAFKKALNETGLGNHPELVRVFVRIGRAMTEDQLVLPSGQSTAPKSPAEVLYGDTSINKEK